MAFTTQIFLFAFFPICMFLYYFYTSLQSKGLFSMFLTRCRLSDLTLIGISACFYLWTCFDDIFRFALYILMIHLLGRFVEATCQKSYYITAECETSPEHKKHVPLALLVLFLSVIITVCILVHFKYTALIATVWNYLFKDNIALKSYLAPLGISFITFSAISYLADVYKGKAKAGSIIDCALYLLFFPKVVSGPIVLWRDFSCQIQNRKISLDLIITGANRLMIGFAKKLILADTFGACIASASGSVDVPTAWGIALLYMLQIYYDFSGYSDIAIGLSNMLGFSFYENFNFPYLSASITEFWRRWHISLGTWFREYIYFPLGGSRLGKKRAVINVAIVFILTGIWHGAGWTYMLWGIINGICNIVEKLISGKTWYKKTPNILKWLCTMGVTFLCWELFRFNDFFSCIQWFKIMLGQVEFSSIPYTWQHYFDLRMMVLMIVAILGATAFGLPKVQRAYQQAIQRPYGYAIRQIVIIALFIVSVLFMVNSTYSPFIYFQY